MSVSLLDQVAREPESTTGTVSGAQWPVPRLLRILVGVRRDPAGPNRSAVGHLSARSKTIAQAAATAVQERWPQAPAALPVYSEGHQGRDVEEVRGHRFLLVDALVLGIVGAGAARVFAWMLTTAQHFFLTRLAGYQPPGLPGEGHSLQQVVGSHGLWLVPVATTLGGLIAGVLVYSLAPEAEGHGTDTAVAAFHRAGGFIRARVSPLKAVASAITIGSGGAAGREGPTALIAAGVGSMYASLTKRPEEERRLLVLMGMAAGLSAIFRSPIGTAVFAVEVLYSGMEFDAGALVYTLLAAVTAYAVNGLFVGFAPLFVVPATLSTPVFADYFRYAALGLISGVVATLVPMVFYGLRDLFRAIPLPPHVKPAIGGLGVGLLGLALPQVLGGGYGWIQAAIDGRLAATLMLGLVLAKLLAFALTVSSGGSGGVFAPSLFVGAMLGGYLALILDQPVAPFVVVGMAAVFAGAARVPIATMLMVTEMTGGYQLLVPAGLAVILSYVVQSALSGRLKYRSLYEAQVSGPAFSPAHHAEHLRAAFRMLKETPTPALRQVGHVDLRVLLESGVPLDLPDGKQLCVARLAPESPLVGQAIIAQRFAGIAAGVELVAVLRETYTVLAGSGAKLRGGDTLVLIAPGGALQPLAGHLLPANA
jgi:chloride channel protein, CIC family